MVNAAENFGRHVVQNAIDEYGKDVRADCGHDLADLTIKTGTCCCFFGGIDDDAAKIALIAALALGVFVGMVCTIRSSVLAGNYESNRQTAHHCSQSAGGDDARIYQNAEVVLIEMRNHRLGKIFSEGLMTVGAGALTVAIIIACVMEPEIYMIGIGTGGLGCIFAGGATYATQSFRGPSERLREALRELVADIK